MVMKGNQVRFKPNVFRRSFMVLLALVISGLLTVTLEGASKPKRDLPTTPRPKQKEFNTAKDAAESLIKAAAAFDVAALLEILGPDGTDIVRSEDPVEDKNRALAFAAKAKDKMALGSDPKNPNRVILTVGNDDF